MSHLMTGIRSPPSIGGSLDQNWVSKKRDEAWTNGLLGVSGRMAQARLWSLVAAGYETQDEAAGGWSKGKPVGEGVTCSRYRTIHDDKSPS